MKYSDAIKIVENEIRANRDLAMHYYCVSAESEEFYRNKADAFERVLMEVEKNGA